MSHTPPNPATVVAHRKRIRTHLDGIDAQRDSDGGLAVSEHVDDEALDLLVERLIVDGSLS